MHRLKLIYQPITTTTTSTTTPSVATPSAATTNLLLIIMFYLYIASPQNLVHVAKLITEINKLQLNKYSKAK